MIRKAYVAEQFYPSNPQELRKTLEKLTPQKETKIDAKGMIIPHAGYIYSGTVAAATVYRTIPKSKIIILGTNHTGRGKPFSMFGEGAWNTPLGNIEIDHQLVQAILENGSLIKEDYSAHIQEHSIEVELPILQYYFGEFTFVPIVCALSTIEIYRQVGQQIFKAIRDTKEKVLLIASSDMTHYEEDSTARRKDRLATENILSLDDEELIKRVEQEHISMCGISPVAILLYCCKLLKATKPRVILYQTSAETNGNRSSVVGYLGVIIS